MRERPPTIGTATAPRPAAAAVIVLAAAVAAGCSAGPLRPVDGDDRDTSGDYDGDYTLRMPERPRGFQNVGTWRMNCATDGFEIPMTVRGGAARLRTRFTGATDPKAPVTAFVGKGGEFRFEVPLAQRASATGTSSSTLDNGAMKLIYAGEIAPEEDSKGTYTVGIAEFGYAGCAYGYTIEPAG